MKRAIVELVEAAAGAVGFVLVVVMEVFFGV